MSAMEGVRAQIRDIPLENIANLAKDRFGDPSIIPLWFGEGDVRAPAFIGEAMLRAVSAGHVFYTHQNGIPELRETLSQYLCGLGRKPVGPERVTVTASGMNAIMLAIQLVCEPGDNIVAVDPVWPNTGGMARLVGAEVRSARMDHGQGGWRLDPERFAATMDARTRVVFFASPGNPTGAMIPIETQAEVLRLCRERGVWLIADEVYNRLAFGRNAAPTILDIADPEDRLIVINSFSKSWAMTGWRLGWMVMPRGLAPTVEKLLEFNTSGGQGFLQRAGITALEEGEGFVAEQIARYRAGRDLVTQRLGGMRRARVTRSEASMYLMFQVEGESDSYDLALRLVEEARVGLAPGVAFGAGGEGYLRLCFAANTRKLAEAMDRLEPILG